MSSKNNKGQALVETIVIMKFVVLGVSALLVGLHCLLLTYLSDHWVYQSAICISQEQPKWICKKELNRNLSMIPFSKHKILQFGKSETNANVQVRTIFLSYEFNFEEKVSRYLTSREFGRAQ